MSFEEVHGQEGNHQERPSQNPIWIEEQLVEALERNKELEKAHREALNQASWDLKQAKSEIEKLKASSKERDFDKMEYLPEQENFSEIQSGKKNLWGQRSEAAKEKQELLRVLKEKEQENEVLLLQLKGQKQQIEIENVNLTKRVYQLSRDLMAREEQVFELKGRLLEETGRVQQLRRKEAEMRQRLTFSQELNRSHPLNSIEVTNAIEFNNFHVRELEEEIERLQAENLEMKDQMYEMFVQKHRNGNQPKNEEKTSSLETEHCE